MAKAVLKGAAYALIQANDMALYQGSTATSERRSAPESDFLKELPQHFRSFADTVAYAPNQAYIGNIRPRELRELPRPWYANPLANAKADGKYGAIIDEQALYGLMKAVDVFDLVLLEAGFLAAAKQQLLTLDGVAAWKCLERLDKNPADAAAIAEQLSEHHAEPLYYQQQVVGCVKRAHEFDAALSAHVMLENLVAKASAAFCLQQLLNKSELQADEVEYIIECSEEACGDMNQRGGGNFAKAIGEICGCVNATGSDTRSFCAGPAHAAVEAAALIASGVYRHVLIIAGGASAKLGMNSRDHVKKGLPMLEDCLGAFAVHFAEDDGVSPVIRLDAVGRHRIGSGASPQAVMQAIVADPLDKAGLAIADIDVFSAEMQNPDITEPAGAGDVPASNFKMIAALGVMRGEFAKADLPQIVERIGMPGFAPTQGHIPSGVPFLGHCREMLLSGEARRAMIIGKGSLFLGRLTNLFDGVSFVIEANSGASSASSVAAAVAKTRVGLTIMGSEHPATELVKGAEQAAAADPNLEVVLIGSGVSSELQLIEAADAESARAKLDELLSAGQLDAAATMHYSFPLGVSTVGRVITPAYGKKLYLGNTTGTSATERVAALVRNAVSAIACAKACGNAAPTLGLLNIEGARAAERILRKMQANGYAINFADSDRADGGSVMRGNDLLRGVPDIMIADSLTGNVLVKMFSAFNSGGSYEALGDGYGPGVGENYGRVINIISRASGAPVIAGALAYAAACARGKLPQLAAAEFAAARKAGMEQLLSESCDNAPPAAEQVSAPPEKVVTEEIPGIEVFEIENAVQHLWKHGIYASGGMGCTGPVVLVADEDHQKAVELLKEAQYL
ncbi:MAG: glycine/sarcosine/betaine reductase complex component C subunit beta [Bacillota bacterium]|nr:glycine/sarcosine/betaine reductase complex component C subunit beta [Bacillota bacterium]